MVVFLFIVFHWKFYSVVIVKLIVFFFFFLCVCAWKLEPIWPCIGRVIRSVLFGASTSSVLEY